MAHSHTRLGHLSGKVRDGVLDVAGVVVPGGGVAEDPVVYFAALAVGDGLDDPDCADFDAFEFEDEEEVVEEGLVHFFVEAIGVGKDDGDGGGGGAGRKVEGDVLRDGEFELGFGEEGLGAARVFAGVGGGDEVLCGAEEGG